MGRVKGFCSEQGALELLRLGPMPQIRVTGDTTTTTTTITTTTTTTIFPTATKSENWDSLPYVQ